MKKRTVAAATALTLFSGCSNVEQAEVHRSTPSVSEPTETTVKPLDELTLGQRATGLFSIRLCLDDSPAQYADFDLNTVSSKPVTVGIQEEGIQAKDSPLLAAGAIIQELGDGKYRVATSDDKPGESSVIDLRRNAYATILQGEKDYDVSFTARIGEDGVAYFAAACLLNMSRQHPQKAPSDGQSSEPHQDPAPVKPEPTSPFEGDLY